MKKDEVARQQARAEYEVVLQRQELMKAEQMVFTAERAKLHQLAEEQKVGQGYSYLLVIFTWVY